MQDREREHCISVALNEGIRAGGLAALVSGSLVTGAHTYWPWFRKSLGIR